MRPLRAAGPAVSAVVIAVSVVTAALSSPDHLGTLSIVLGVAAVIAGLIVGDGTGGAPMVSSSFIVFSLAATFLGPVSGALAAIISEVCSTIRQRTKLRTALLINLPACVVPAVVEGVVIRGLFSEPTNTAAFYIAVTLATIIGYVLSFAMFALLRAVNKPDAERIPLQVLVDSLPSAALSIALTIAGVAITLVVGSAGIAFALAGVFAFSYMMFLLEESRRRAEQYRVLSVGVLGGLMRALEVRDPAVARHAAAVARFSEDIAKAAGMSSEDAELANTAGLLHDIGRFALSDRVAERGRTLNDEDWDAIHQHPLLGAVMLQDLGAYGPVADIVLCHHERIDGRGYPHRLKGPEIPEIAKIVAVAEVYDTLTAEDTYRTQMSSFEALTELRRVAGTQLDERYVEVLAQLLTGSGVGYRHATLVDFDAELNRKRLITGANADRTPLITAANARRILRLPGLQPVWRWLRGSTF
jgi:putative nucleotidyltransferase with HDIG domain